jgi:ABC-type bacteriocin/lantibiotic exporter with double-glycine peptidase domain
MDLLAPDGIRPKEALRFAFVNEQGFDRSCGYSAAASLLSLYWSIPVDEEELVRRYALEDLESGRLAVTFATLARILGDYGFAAKAVVMTWPQLGEALGKYSPIILHYARPDRHFVLAIYAKDGWIITLDPALGCELQSREQFMERWSGAALLAWSSKAPRNEGLLTEALRVEEDRHELLDSLGLD